MLIGALSQAFMPCAPCPNQWCLQGFPTIYGILQKDVWFFNNIAHNDMVMARMRMMKNPYYHQYLPYCHQHTVINIS